VFAVHGGLENLNAQNARIVIQDIEKELAVEIRPCGVIDGNAAAIGLYQSCNDA
jgi:hypothetical protein